jgi:hypothetical protein
MPQTSEHVIWAFAPSGERLHRCALVPQPRPAGFPLDALIRGVELPGHSQEHDALLKQFESLGVPEFSPAADDDAEVERFGPIETNKGAVLVEPTAQQREAGREGVFVHDRRSHCAAPEPEQNTEPGEHGSSAPGDRSSVKST